MRLVGSEPVLDEGSIFPTMDSRPRSAFRAASGAVVFVVEEPVSQCTAVHTCVLAGISKNVAARQQGFEQGEAHGLQGRRATAFTVTVLWAVLWVQVLLFVGAPCE